MAYFRENLGQSIVKINKKENLEQWRDVALGAGVNLHTPRNTLKVVGDLEIEAEYDTEREIELRLPDFGLDDGFVLSWEEGEKYGDGVIQAVVTDTVLHLSFRMHFTKFSQVVSNIKSFYEHGAPLGRNFFMPQRIVTGEDAENLLDTIGCNQIWFDRCRSVGYGYMNEHPIFFSRTSYPDGSWTISGTRLIVYPKHLKVEDGFYGFRIF